MGRFLLGVGILVAFLGLGLWVSVTMDDVQSEISQTLDAAVEQTMDGDLAAGIALAQQAKQRWQENWHSTASVADHEPMDEIDGLFAQLEIYGKAGLSGDFATYCARLSNLVAAVGEAHSLTWWNLL